MTVRKTPTKAPATKAPVQTESERDAERDSQMRAAYQSAIATLKANHNDEWNSLLNDEYASRGLEVRRRLTEEERVSRAAAKIEERRQKLLDKLAALEGDQPTLSLVEDDDAVADPFAS